MQFNVISGLPRSGSTLLCNILNQNPQFHATSTSALLDVVKSMQQVYANSVEYKSLAINDPEGVDTKMANSMRAVISMWYGEYNVVFDKCRQWPLNFNLLKTLYPSAKMICTVRDLRDVFGSIEKRHKETALWDHPEPMRDTIENRASVMFSKDGLIGNCVAGMDDLYNRKTADVMYVRMEDLASNPELIMSQIYSFLGYEKFDHDFSDIKDTACDVDVLYNNKYPHHGNKQELQPINSDSWKEHMTDQIGQQIVDMFPAFFNRFRYYG